MNDSREHILLTSLTLFLQKGFKEVTMKEIVDKTGMSKGAFYHYFSSKEQVFTDVINHFFGSMMTANYPGFSHDSLHQFYNDILQQLEKNRLAFEKLVTRQKKSSFSNNYYYLIFDAMRMLPEFKQHHQNEQKDEIRAWKQIVVIAKKNSEIKTTMTDEQVAKLFIYLGDGTNINLIMNDNIKNKKNELKFLWDGLYKSLKTK